MSVLAHGLLLFGSVDGRLPVLPRAPLRIVVLAAPGEGRDVTMWYQRYQESRSLRPAGPRSPARPGPAPAPRSPRPGPAIVRPSPEPQRVALHTGTVPATVPSRAPESLVAPEPPGRIGPGLAQGRLWVRPLPLPPRELASRLTRSHAALVDSAVTAVVQAFLDSVAAEPASRDAALPSWTTEVAGRKFGLDAKNIYIAGLKIPAAVLALLPIPGGNLDQNRAYNHMMDLRADIQYAAQRAENAAEFKRIIREMRERKERERDFARNQRRAPAASAPGQRAPARPDSASESVASEKGSAP